MAEIQSPPSSLSLPLSLSLARSLALALSRPQQCWRRSTARDQSTKTRSFSWLDSNDSPSHPIGPSRDREKNFRARKSRERFVFEFISRVSLSNLDANLRSDGNFPALAKERRWMEEEETENEEERRSEAKRIDELRQYDLSRHPRSRQRFT